MKQTITHTTCDVCKKPITNDDRPHEIIVLPPLEAERKSYDLCWSCLKKLGEFLTGGTAP